MRKTVETPTKTPEQTAPQTRWMMDVKDIIKYGAIATALAVGLFFALLVLPRLFHAY